jgi:hypothetical protein
MYQVNEFQILHQLFEADKLTENELLSTIEELNSEPHANRPWLTEEWKSKREDILREACEKCGSEDSLILQHKPGTKPKLKNYLNCNSKQEYLDYIQSIIRYRSLEYDIQTYCRKCAYHEDKSAGLIPKKIKNLFKKA